MTDITTIDSLALLTVFGKENYSRENEFDTDKFNFQESDQPRSDDRQRLSTIHSRRETL